MKTILAIAFLAIMIAVPMVLAFPGNFNAATHADEIFGGGSDDFGFLGTTPAGAAILLPFESPAERDFPYAYFPGFSGIADLIEDYDLQGASAFAQGFNW
jgi:hypothetical protein